MHGAMRACEAVRRSDDSQTTDDGTPAGVHRLQVTVSWARYCRVNVDVLHLMSGGQVTTGSRLPQSKM